MVIPSLFVFLLWMVRIIETIGEYEFGFLGIYPLRWSGLVGIIASPFIHGDFSHLISNTVPLLVLGSALFYFYKDLALRIFLWLFLLTGFWVWIAARPAYHIGASGIVYGLATFIFASGAIRKHSGLMAVALVVVFLYGSLVWGIFPEFFPEKNISWESHLLGMVAGLILAIYYRNVGPQRQKFEWELEEEEGGRSDPGPSGEEGVNGEYESDVEDDYWKTDITDEEIKKIKRVFRPGRYDNN